MPLGDVTPPNGTAEYVAFGTKDKVHRLRLRSNKAPDHAIAYNILLDVVSDGEYGTNVILLYTIVMCMVRGRNLQKMIFALEHGMADFVQEFNPEKWPKPTDESAAFIESIEIKILEGSAFPPDPNTKH